MRYRSLGWVGMVAWLGLWPATGHANNLANAREAMKKGDLLWHPTDGQPYRRATSTKPYQFIRFGGGCPSIGGPASRGPPPSDPPGGGAQLLALKMRRMLKSPVSKISRSPS